MRTEQNQSGLNHTPDQSNKIPVNIVDDIAHIASFAVRFLPRAEQSLRSTVLGIPNCEIAYQDDQGSAVILLEASDNQLITEAHKVLGAVDGVLNINLVYHHAEEKHELDSIVATEEGC